MSFRSFRNDFCVAIKKLRSYDRGRFFTKRFLAQIACFLGGLILCIVYYFYLDALYLVDEILEGDALRELTIEEKTTVYLRQAPVSLEHLKKFILHYSICPAVFEIRVLWNKQIMGTDAPDQSSFKYTKTHSHVTFISDDKHKQTGVLEGGHDSGELFETEGVLLLDPDVYVSCTDIAFAQGVWRSGDAMVGFFPRLHSFSSNEKTRKTDWKMHGWASMITKQAYSFMLPAGLFLHKKYLLISDLDKSMGIVKSSDFPSQLSKLKDFLTRNPVCEDISIPLVASWLMPRPPIFVDVPVTVRSGVKVPELNPSEHRKEECMTFIADILNKQDLELSSYKSTKAKNHLFW